MSGSLHTTQYHIGPHTAGHRRSSRGVFSRQGGEEHGDLGPKSTPVITRCRLASVVKLCCQSGLGVDVELESGRSSTAIVTM